MANEEDFGYFTQIDAEIRANECKACCNRKYCVQGKINVHWLKLITTEVAICEGTEK